MSDPPLRARVLLAGVIGLLALLGLAAAARTQLELGGAYPLKAALVFIAVMTFVIVVVRGRHRFPSLGSANHLTIGRAALVAWMAGFIGEPPAAVNAASVTGAATLCAVLDGVDGWLARREGMASEFGARFDMETDALLIMVLSVLAWQYDKAGAWILLCGLMRYLFAAAGWALPWMRGHLSPTVRAKTVAVVQMVGLAVTVSPFVRPPLSTVTAAVTLAALCWSFAIDVGRLWRKRV